MLESSQSTRIYIMAGPVVRISPLSPNSQISGIRTKLMLTKNNVRDIAPRACEPFLTVLQKQHFCNGYLLSAAIY